MLCLWLAWRFFVGSFGFGLARCLTSVWGMYQCHYGSGSGIPKLVRGACGHGPYRPARIDTKRPRLDGPRLRACERATICFLEGVLGWRTCS